MTRLAHDLEDELEAEYEAELEYETEDEYEDEYEDEWEGEDEDFFPMLGGIARAVGGMLGGGGGGGGDSEYEDEWEGEDEVELEAEDEAFLGALGPIAKVVGGLFGGGDGEIEGEFEDEDEAEEFFGRIRGLIKRAAPYLRTIAKTAGPLVATAVGGPAAGALARAVASQLEGELEDELEAEFEDMATAPLTGAQALGEYLAGRAAAAESEGEAEALAGVAAYVSLTSADRQTLQQMIPSLLRGAAVLTRMLHQNRRSRPAVRMLPGIVDGAARTLARQVAAGAAPSPADVGAALGASTTRALASGPANTAIVRRHARGLAQSYRRRGHHGRRYYYGAGYPGYPGGYSGGGYRGGGYRGGVRVGYGPRATGRGVRWAGRPAVATVKRQATTTRIAPRSARVTRPRPGFVRVVTPVRVAARGGVPARTVRMVSDIRVPRGAKAAGRPVSVSAPRRR
jgi:hypothetical protein